jgi:hypothetical protein
MRLQIAANYGTMIPRYKFSKDGKMTKKCDGDAGEEKPGDGCLHDGDDTVVSIKDAAKHGKRKLTGKMMAFCDGILRGLSQSESYRQAYDAKNMADTSVWTESSKLFAHVKTPEQ